MALKPALFVLFGTTGDLAHKKLLPALYTLERSGQLAPGSTIVGIGRRDWTDEYYREQVLAALRVSEPISPQAAAAFCQRFFYYRMDISQVADYSGLWSCLAKREKEQGLTGDRLYFLATAPQLFPLLARQIGHEIKKPGSFRRLLIEKPFGRDLASAEEFNASLRTVFAEDEIYRIDHYLGKEMLQNILILRFANQIFEPGWNRQHIDHIQISVSELIGIGQRGGYYDTSGALRDMVQSHLLQLLALIAMDAPAEPGAEGIRSAKARLLRQLRPFDLERARADAVLGQYGGSSQKLAYLAETGVGANSQTETFAALRLFVDNERWQGVPFYLRTGKRLDQQLAKITIVYKNKLYPALDQTQHNNILVIRVQPQEGIDLRFNIKRPGMNAAITEAGMNICHSCDPALPTVEAYEKLLHDAWQGDLGLFTRWDEIEAAWMLIDSLRRWQEQLPLHIYQPGTKGPAAAELLPVHDGRVWLDL